MLKNKVLLIADAGSCMRTGGGYTYSLNLIKILVAVKNIDLEILTLTKVKLDSGNSKCYNLAHEM